MDLFPPCPAHAPRPPYANRRALAWFLNLLRRFHRPPVPAAAAAAAVDPARLNAVMDDVTDGGDDDPAQYSS